MTAFMTSRTRVLPVHARSGKTGLQPVVFRRAMKAFPES